VRVLADVPRRWEFCPVAKGSAEASRRFHAAAMSIPGAIDLVPGWDPATMLTADGIQGNERGVALQPL